MSNEMATDPEGELFPQEHRYSVIEERGYLSEVIRQWSAPLALVTIHLSYARAEKSAQASRELDQRAHESSTHILQHLRSFVRKTDQVFLHQHDMYFLLAGANLQGAQIVEDRLWEALLWRTHNMSEQQMIRPCSMTIGHGAFLELQTSPDALLTAADEVNKRFEERATSRERDNGACQLTGVDQDEPEALPQLAKKLGVPYLSPLPLQLPRRLQQLVSAKLAHELHCYPVGRERNTLTVAMRDPQDRRALERLHQVTGLRIFPVLAHPDALENVLKHLN